MIFLTLQQFDPVPNLLHEILAYTWGHMKVPTVFYQHFEKLQKERRPRIAKII